MLVHNDSLNLMNPILNQCSLLLLLHRRALGEEAVHVGALDLGVGGRRLAALAPLARVLLARRRLLALLVLLSLVGLRLLRPRGPRGVQLALLRLRLTHLDRGRLPGLLG